MKRRGYNFSVKVYRGNELHKDYTDTFLVVKFNGIIVKTCVKHKNSSPEWNQVLIMPVYTPCFCDVVEIQLWNYRRASPDTLLSKMQIPFSLILSNPLPPSWFNFYGDSLRANSAGGWLQKLVSTSEVASIEYLGKFLMSFDVQLCEAPVSEERIAAPIQPPSNEWYILRLDLYRASELAIQNSSEVMVEVSFGPPENKRFTSWCKCEKGDSGKSNIRFKCNSENSYSHAASKSGECQFQEIRVLLPRSRNSNFDVGEIYDVLIDVYARGVLSSRRKIGYIRIGGTDRVKLSMQRQGAAIPEWHAISGVKQRDSSSCTKGFLLLGCALLPEDEYSNGRDTIRPIEMIPYQLTAHVYQARNLFTEYSNEPVSSFVEVSIDGHKAKLVFTHPLHWENAPDEEKNARYSTSLCPDTDNPVWYETLCIASIDLPTDLNRSSGIKVSVICMNAGRKREVGHVVLPADILTKDMWNDKPRWLRLSNGKLTTRARAYSTQSVPSPLDRRSQISSCGDLLIKLELSRLADVSMGSVSQWKWPSVMPVDLHIHCIGLRNMRKYMEMFGNVGDLKLKLNVESLPDMSELDTFIEKTERLADEDVESGYHADRSQSISGKEEILADAKSNKKTNLSSVLHEIYLNKPPGALQQYEKGEWFGGTQVRVLNFGKASSNIQNNLANAGNDTPDADDERNENGTGESPQCAQDFVFRINIPIDPFFAQAICVYVSGKTWFSEVMVGKGNVSIRRFAQGIYDEKVVKKLDATFDVFYMQEKSYIGISQRLIMQKEIAMDSCFSGKLNSDTTNTLRDAADGETNGMKENTFEKSSLQCEGHFELPKKILVNMESINFDVQDEISDDNPEEKLDSHFSNDPEMMGLLEGSPAVFVSGSSRSTISMLWPGNTQTLDSHRRANKEVMCDLENTYVFDSLSYFRLGIHKVTSMSSIRTGIFKFSASILKKGETSTARENGIVPMRIDPFDSNSKDLTLDVPEKNTKLVYNPYLNIPQILTLRIYVVDISDIIPSNGLMKPSPYLKFALRSPSGLLPQDESQVTDYLIDDRANGKKQTSNPYFGSRFDMKVQYPEVTEVEIQVWDAGFVSDSLIGSTTIDIEDRWFSESWQSLKRDGIVPREHRALWHPKALQSQGKMCMWLELYSGKESAEVPLHDLRPQITKEWELRVVVWETRRVPQLENHSKSLFYNFC